MSVDRYSMQHIYPKYSEPQLQFGYNKYVNDSISNKMSHNQSYDKSEPVGESFDRTEENELNTD